jgi:hypothetical protein
MSSTSTTTKIICYKWLECLAKVKWKQYNAIVDWKFNSECNNNESDQRLINLLDVVGKIELLIN